MTPIKHGKRSLIPRRSIVELQAQYLADPEPLRLEQELALARALLQDFLGRAKQTPSTYNGTAMQLTTDVSRLVERIERIRAANAISLPAMQRAMSEMARVVEAFVPDPAVLQKIKEAWLTIRFG